MSFKDFSTAHPDAKLSPLAAKQTKPQIAKAAQASMARAQLGRTHAPRQPTAKH